MSAVFAEWNEGVLDSFLIEITRDILAFEDADGTPLVEKIRDTAGQKGTGKWTAVSSLDLGVPVTLIGEAVFARCLSALQPERVAASQVLKGPKDLSDCKAACEEVMSPEDRKSFICDLRDALYASKIVSYTQGFMLLREAAKENEWKLNYPGVALMWRGGCIIRSVFLGKIKEAFEKKQDLASLLLDDFFKREAERCQRGWRRVVSECALRGVPAPAFSTALSFYDSYRTARLPANLLQAQRDYFGAHTYELLAEPGKFVHTNWTGHGGNVSATTYTA